MGFEPMDEGFADLCLTTWLRRRTVGIILAIYAAWQGESTEW